MDSISSLAKGASMHALTQFEAAAKRLNVTGDGWENVITGLGDPTRDKRFGAAAFSQILDYETLTELYRATDTAKTIVDRFANEITREWLDPTITDDEEAAEASGKYLDRLHAQQRFWNAIKWERHYGGALVLMGINDGNSDPAEPVDEKAIRSIDFLTVFDPSEARVIQWQANPAAPEYGEPEFYQIFPRIFGLGAATVLQKVHHSRVLRFVGPLANRWQVAIRQGWGDSIFDDIWQAVRDFDNSFNNVAAMLQDFSQAVFKMKDLAEAMGSNKEKLIVNRLKMMDYARSVVRGIVIDADKEDFDRKATPVTGLADILDRFTRRMAAAAKMPVSVFMGQTAGALGGNNGDNEIEMWFATLKALQTTKYSHPMKKLLRYIFLAGDGPTKKIVPDNFDVKWRPLSQLSDAEKAKRNYDQANADNLNIQNGIVTPLEVRTNRFEGDEYSVDTFVDHPEDFADTSAPGEGEPNEEPGQAPSAGEQPGQPVIAGASISAKDPGPDALKKASPAIQNPAGQMPPKAKPTLGIPIGSEPAVPKAQDKGMQGNQVNAAHEIVKSGAKGEIPAEAVTHLLVHMLGMTPEAAQALVATLEGFEPKVDPLALAQAQAKAKGLNNSTNKAGKSSAGATSKPVNKDEKPKKRITTDSKKRKAKKA